MNKELLSSVVIAAATAALVSNGMILIAQWRERAARQRELLFTVAVDISKSWIGRIANASRKNAALSEVMAVERVYEMLVEIFEHGRHDWTPNQHRACIGHNQAIAKSQVYRGFGDFCVSGFLTLFVAFIFLRKHCGSNAPTSIPP